MLVAPREGGGFMKYFFSGFLGFLLLSIFACSSSSPQPGSESSTAGKADSGRFDANDNTLTSSSQNKAQNGVSPRSSDEPAESSAQTCRERLRALSILGDIQPHPNGGGLVAPTAVVENSVYVGPNAVVCGTARVTDNVRLEDRVEVSGMAQISDSVVVKGDARIGERANVSGSCFIYGNAYIGGSARVQDRVEVFGNSQVIGQAYLTGREEVYNRTVDGS